MTYITISDLVETIRTNIWKIPHDIDVIVSIPRSGTIAASIIAEFLNKPLTDLASFVNGNHKGEGGGRFDKFGKDWGNERRKVLVVDDTTWSGNSKKEAKERVKDLTDRFDFIYLAVYLEGPVENAVDIYLENVRKYTHNFQSMVVYEWNIFHHYITAGYMMDMDGILCVDPPDERNTEEYEKYIKDAVPLITPTSPVGVICTYRLNKYREVTEEWLKKNKVDFNQLIMFNANTWVVRGSSLPPALYKAQAYLNSNCLLFVESDIYQAEEIYHRTLRPVYCIANNRLYGNEYKN